MNPDKIDKHLDAVREITANYDASEIRHLNRADTDRLYNAYLETEQYLVESEPIKDYSQQSIRYYLSHRLNLSSDDQITFWRRLIDPESSI